VSDCPGFKSYLSFAIIVILDKFLCLISLQNEAKISTYLKGCKDLSTLWKSLVWCLAHKSTQSMSIYYYYVKGLNTSDDRVTANLLFIQQVPRIFINGTFIGGATDTHRLHKEGKLLPLVHQCYLKKSKRKEF